MKIKSLLLALLCVSACGLMEAKVAGKSAMCSQAACGDDQNCHCYCSVKCGPREQDEEDRPVFATKDAQGNAVPAKCYCKSNDRDEYNRHCSSNAPKKIMSRRQARRYARRTSN